jgi:hypothetical protein
VTVPNDDEGLRKAHAEACAGCGVALAASQRYCLECGERRAPLPPLVAQRIDALRKRGQPCPGATVTGGPPIAPVDPAAEEGEETGYWRFMPSPQVAAVVVMALLAAGVVLGSVTSPFARSASFAPIILEMAEEESSESSPEPASPPSFAAEPAPLAASAEEPLVPAPETPEATPEASEPPAQLPPELPEEELLPEIKHVFLIVLDGYGYEEAFGKASSAPYLAKTLPGQGELLSNYYSVTQGGLANEIALLSGQGPTPQTAANCSEYTAIAPGTVGAEEQVEGSGCVYPAGTLTLPGQLVEKAMTWKAYVEDIGNGAAAGQPASCRHPALGAADSSQVPVPGDAYETWRNPFVYFSALTESPECAEDDIGLDRLTADLEKAKKTPSFSYIVPNACHDGNEAPCAPEQPAGLAGAEGFLKTVVPEIKASPAYKEGGLIAITFDQAPQTGPNADSSSCCATPEYPNLPPPPTAAAPSGGPVKETGGGGRVGLLLISPFVEAGSVNETGYYNHFSLLRSIEELFGLQPIGYAANPALSPFDSTVYNAKAKAKSAGG